MNLVRLLWKLVWSSFVYCLKLWCKVVGCIYGVWGDILLKAIKAYKNNKFCFKGLKYLKLNYDTLNRVQNVSI